MTLANMFDVYIKNYKRDDSVITKEAKMFSVPFASGQSPQILNPVVKLTVGSVGTFSFEMESDSTWYDAFMQVKTIVRIVYDGTTIFRGRVLTIDNTMWGNRKIQCEDALSFLNDTQIEGVQDNKRSTRYVGGYINDLISNHNSACDSADKSFGIGEIPGNYSSNISNEQKVDDESRKHGSSSWGSTKSRLDELTSSYGGYWRARYDDATGNKTDISQYTKKEGMHYVKTEYFYTQQ